MPFTDAILVLPNPKRIPQAFSFSGGKIYVGQLNVEADAALITCFTLSGSTWRAGEYMTVQRCHGWPLIARTLGGVKQVGCYSAKKWRWFTWKHKAVRTPGQGKVATRIPVIGGWNRTTSGGVDRFYRGSTFLFQRNSPGWVQGELVRNNVLLTLRGSPTYTGNSYPDGVPPKITYTNSDGTSGGATADVPATFGHVGGVPIGGRAEAEGMWLYEGGLLIGMAVNYKPNYKYAIYNSVL